PASRPPQCSGYRIMTCCRGWIRKGTRSAAGGPGARPGHPLELTGAAETGGRGGVANALSVLMAIGGPRDDDAYRLVFADWLEENGDWRAEFLRLDCAPRALPADRPTPTDLLSRWLELRSRLSPSWQTVLGRSVIENCDSRFLFRCPERWD